ncbi:MAG: CAP domain-containing protein, partial [Thermus sp.]
MKKPALSVLGLVLLAFVLGGCNTLLFSRPPVEVLGGPTVYLEAHPGEEESVTVRLAPGAEGARVFLRLSDPCAQGKASCPGWDPTRYPGVEHTQEAFELSASTLEATFHFRVAPDALPQG